MSEEAVCFIIVFLTFKTPVLLIDVIGVLLLWTVSVAHWGQTVWILPIKYNYNLILQLIKYNYKTPCILWTTLLRYLDLEGLMVTLRMSCCELRGLIVSIVQLRLVPCAIASPATTDTHLSELRAGSDVRPVRVRRITSSQIVSLYVHTYKHCKVFHSILEHFQCACQMDWITPHESLKR